MLREKVCYSKSLVQNSLWLLKSVIKMIFWFSPNCHTRLYNHRRLLEAQTGDLESRAIVPSMQLKQRR